MNTAPGYIVSLGPPSKKVQKVPTIDVRGIIKKSTIQKERWTKLPRSSSKPTLHENATTLKGKVEGGTVDLFEQNETNRTAGHRYYKANSLETDLSQEATQLQRRTSKYRIRDSSSLGTTDAQQSPSRARTDFMMPNFQRDARVNTDQYEVVSSGKGIFDGTRTSGKLQTLFTNQALSKLEMITEDAKNTEIEKQKPEIGGDGIGTASKEPSTVKRLPGFAPITSYSPEKFIKKSSPISNNKLFSIKDGAGIRANLKMDKLGSSKMVRTKFESSNSVSYLKDESVSQAIEPSFSVGHKMTVTPGKSSSNDKSNKEGEQTGQPVAAAPLSSSKQQESRLISILAASVNRSNQLNMFSTSSKFGSKYMASAATKQELNVAVASRQNMPGVGFSSKVTKFEPKRPVEIRAAPRMPVSEQHRLFLNTQQYYMRSLREGSEAHKKHIETTHAQFRPLIDYYYDPDDFPRKVHITSRRV